MNVFFKGNIKEIFTLKVHSINLKHLSKRKTLSISNTVTLNLFILPRINTFHHKYSIIDSENK